MSEKSFDNLEGLCPKNKTPWGVRELKDAYMVISPPSEVVHAAIEAREFPITPRRICIVDKSSVYIEAEKIAKFIAEAGNQLPSLLERLRFLEEENEFLRKITDDLKTESSGYQRGLRDALKVDPDFDY